VVKGSALTCRVELLRTQHCGKSGGPYQYPRRPLRNCIGPTISASSDGIIRLMRQGRQRAVVPNGARRPVVEGQVRRDVQPGRAWLVTTDGIEDVQDLGLWLDVNAVRRQTGPRRMVQERSGTARLCSVRTCDLTCPGAGRRTAPPHRDAEVPRTCRHRPPPLSPCVSLAVDGGHFVRPWELTSCHPCRRLVPPPP
jgi:hypothetical protein